MAEHIGQTVEVELSPFNMMGQPIGQKARASGYEHCKAMGLTSARAKECTDAVAEQLQRDKPYEAQGAAMKHLDLIGAYRLVAALLTAAVAEKKEQ